MVYFVATSGLKQYIQFSRDTLKILFWKLVKYDDRVL